MSGIYIHVPFCKQACSYCDFYFVTREQDKTAYIQALIEEIRSYRDSPESSEPVHSIYFGGGTPSRLSVSSVERIMEALHDVFDIQADEITLEMNPDDVSREYLVGLYRAGINRSSMGVQSFDADLLSFMHRAHAREEAIACLEILSVSPIEQFTVDLIYGNPGQSLATVEKDLEILLSYEPPHLSAYSLTIESGTRLGKQLELNRLIPADDDLVAEQADLIRARCLEAGIQQYEVSNYARPGAEAQHNSAYWTHENYLGLGPSAHSFWWDKNQPFAYRRSNDKKLKEYISADQTTACTEERLELQTLAEERIMLGLRTRAGVSESELKNRYTYELNEAQRGYISRQVEVGHMTKSSGLIQLTPSGLNIADRITLDLLTAR